MLNPFHGIVNIAEIAGADAVCRDGVNWTLYIQGGVEAAELADGGEAQVPLPDIKFGTWSAHSGLRRAPVRLVTDYDRLGALGCRLLELVKSAADRTPFPLQDIYEFWLLDSGSQSLSIALLRATWADSEHTNLGRAYLSSQAPWLLALQGMGAVTRRQLERDACKRALLVSELYLTFPEIIDRAALNAARVEARLRLAAGGSRENAGQATTAFFVTGN